MVRTSVLSLPLHSSEPQAGHLLSQPRFPQRSYLPPARVRDDQGRSRTLALRAGMNQTQIPLLPTSARLPKFLVSYQISLMPAIFKPNGYESWIQFCHLHVR